MADNFSPEEDDVLPEYDFTHAVRGRHAGMLGRDAIVVTLDGDLREEFPDAEAVNNALRLLLRIRAELATLP